MKKTSVKKMTKKTVKPDILIDCTGKTPNDIMYSYIKAKAVSGKPITPEELAWLEDTIIDMVPTLFVINEEAAPKKLPWYKRFWKWLRRK